MGKKKVDELRKLSIDELYKKLKETKNLLVEIKSSEQRGKSRALKREIARIITVIREKEGVKKVGGNL